MLRDPCKLCLVKPSCSMTCNEKKDREKTVEYCKLTPMFVMLVVSIVICMAYNLILILLRKTKTISPVMYDHLDPFRDLDMSDPFLY